jgi:hypothetical protein
MNMSYDDIPGITTDAQYETDGFYRDPSRGNVWRPRFADGVEAAQSAARTFSPASPTVSFGDARPAPKPAARPVKPSVPPASANLDRLRAMAGLDDPAEVEFSDEADAGQLAPGKTASAAKDSANLKRLRKLAGLDE